MIQNKSLNQQYLFKEKLLLQFQYGVIALNRAFEEQTNLKNEIDNLMNTLNQKA